MNPSRLQAYILFFLVVLGSGFLFSHLKVSPRSPDEQAYLAWALSFAMEGRIAEPDGRAVGKSVPPLHTLMVGLAFKMLGVKTEVAQAISVLGGALCVGVCFLSGYLILGARGGLLAAVLLLTSGKGEIWDYSNRVLNDIHLTLWVSSTALCAMAYIRHGSPWTAPAMGLFLGLGVLTKESALLAFPILPAAFLLGTGSKRTRLCHFLVAVAVAGSLMAPLLIQRYKALQLRGEQGAGTYGLRAGNLGKLLDAENWGFRGLEELGNNVLLRGMPSGAFRVIYGASLLASVVLIWRRKAPKELALAVLLISIWIGIFQTFLHLPLTRRQLLPLFPAYNLLTAFVLISCWDFFRFHLLQHRVHPKAVTLIGCSVVLGLGALNMSPKAWSQLKPGKMFQGPQPGFLEKEAKEALACAPDAVLLASNLDRALYFVLKGRFSVLHISISQKEESEKASDHRKGKKQRSLGSRGGTPGEATLPVFSNQDKLLSPLYAILFSHKEAGPVDSPPFNQELWELICKAEGFLVFKRLHQAGGKPPFPEEDSQEPMMHIKKGISPMDPTIPCSPSLRASPDSLSHTHMCALNTLFLCLPWMKHMALRELPVGEHSHEGSAPETPIPFSRAQQVRFSNPLFSKLAPAP